MNNFPEAYQLYSLTLTIPAGRKKFFMFKESGKRIYEIQCHSNAPV